jgi:23S rRNA (uracil1939-C5)-methyltransferase
MRKKHKENIIFENVLVEDFAAEAKCISRVEDKVIFIDTCGSWRLCGFTHYKI